MRLSLALLVVLLLFTFTAMASAAVTTHEYVVHTKWNLLSLPGIPLDPDPPSLFGVIPISGNLYKWNAPLQGLDMYIDGDPDSFGHMLLTDGYWLRNTTGSAQPLSFSGLDDNDDMDIWISLPKKGWTLIGNPFSYPFPWVNAKVTDGDSTMLLRDASQWGVRWLSSAAIGWDEVGQGNIVVGVPDDNPTEESLRAWHGYWVRSYKDKVALILESVP
ncbi:MAG TPA: hypothetical protein VMX94_02845 [Armatimonadota bacterium]|nr:hypothetical protein [Armatimonadota bacterium]